MQHRQYPALDILKFVLAFSVIAQHAQVIPALGPFSHFGEAVLWPAVSLFFAVSGFLSKWKWAVPLILVVSFLGMVFLIAAACSCLTALLILPLIHRSRLLSALFHC